MKKNLLTLLFISAFAGILKAQDQTINGDLYIGAGTHDQVGYGKRIYFIGNSDNCFITRYNVTGNVTEFRFNIGDDLFDDKFVVGVTNSGDGLWYPKMTVRGDGNVGIGTTDPTSNLHVLEATDSRPNGVSAATKSILKLSRNGTPNYAYNESAEFRIGHGGGNVWGSQLDLFVNGSANTDNVPDQHAMTWSYNGNVGIGTTSPNAKLDVNGAIATNRNWFYLAGAGDTNHAIGNVGGDGEQFRFFNFFDLHQASTGVSRLYINSTGNIGIGATDPVGKLDVSESGGASGRTVISDQSFYTPQISQYKWSGGGSNFFQTSITSSLSAPGSMDFQTGSGGAAIGSDIQNIRMTLFQNGAVAIGTTTMPSGYTFAVNGNAIATSVTVKPYANWPDYVFHPTYQLPTLTEVKTYIDQNHHLPEMPSAKEVADKGIDLGEMNRLLTKKVEELTLYLIEQNKRIEQLEKQLKH